MPRRRRSVRDIEELLGGIAALVFLLVFWAAGFDLRRFNLIMHGLFALFLLGIAVVVVSVILFFVVRTAIRARRGNHGVYPLQQSERRMRVDLPAILVPSEPIAFSKPSLPSQEDLVSQLRATDWYQFEKVVGLAYAARGYTLHRRGGANPDGGIDLIIESNGEQTAVQCKRWKKWKVDVPRIREFIGALTVAGIRKGVVVTLNGFTPEAKQLAVEHNIDIVHEGNLAVMISELPEDDQRGVQRLLQDETKYCPRCESMMVWRTPKGLENWTPFWGCSRYPICRGKLQDD